MAPRLAHTHNAEDVVATPFQVSLPCSDSGEVRTYVLQAAHLHVQRGASGTIAQRLATPAANQVVGASGHFACVVFHPNTAGDGARVRCVLYDEDADVVRGSVFLGDGGVLRISSWSTLLYVLQSEARAPAFDGVASLEHMAGEGSAVDCDAPVVAPAGVEHGAEDAGDDPVIHGILRCTDAGGSNDNGDAEEEDERVAGLGGVPDASDAPAIHALHVWNALCDRPNYNMFFTVAEMKDRLSRVLGVPRAYVPMYVPGIMDKKVKQSCHRVDVAGDMLACRLTVKELEELGFPNVSGPVYRVPRQPSASLCLRSPWSYREMLLAMSCGVSLAVRDKRGTKEYDAFCARAASDLSEARTHNTDVVYTRAPKGLRGSPYVLFSCTHGRHRSTKTTKAPEDLCKFSLKFRFDLSAGRWRVDKDPIGHSNTHQIVSLPNQCHRMSQIPAAVLEQCREWALSTGVLCRNSTKQFVHYFQATHGIVVSEQAAATARNAIYGRGEAQLQAAATNLSEYADTAKARADRELVARSQRLSPAELSSHELGRLACTVRVSKEKRRLAAEELLRRAQAIRKSEKAVPAWRYEELETALQLDPPRGESYEQEMRACLEKLFGQRKPGAAPAMPSLKHSADQEQFCWLLGQDFRFAHWKVNAQMVESLPVLIERLRGTGGNRGKGEDGDSGVAGLGHAEEPRVLPPLPSRHPGGDVVSHHDGDCGGDVEMREAPDSAVNRSTAPECGKARAHRRKRPRDPASAEREQQPPSARPPPENSRRTRPRRLAAQRSIEMLSLLWADDAMGSGDEVEKIAVRQRRGKAESFKAVHDARWVEDGGKRTFQYRVEFSDPRYEHELYWIDEDNLEVTDSARSELEAQFDKSKLAQ